MNNETLYRIVNASYRCTNDYFVVLFDEGVYCLDMTEKIVHHRNHTTTYFAWKMSESDLVYDKDVGDYIVSESGIPCKITIDNSLGTIIKQTKRRD